MSEYKCGGHCCRDFTLPLSPMEIEHQRRKFVLGKGHFFTDMDKIADMVVYLGEWHETPQNNHRGETKSHRRAAKFRHVHHYTCKHHNAATGDCMNYKNRPGMCSEYPYERACGYTKCEAVCSKKKQEIDFSDDSGILTKEKVA